MAKAVVTILGLGVTGASLGLALKKAQADVEIVGHDKVPEAAQAAKKLSAVDRSEWNLHNACDNAAIIVLALPLSEVDETLALIEEDLRPDTLVIILTDVFQAATGMIERRLGDRHHAVVGQPIRNDISGPATPRADMFDEAVFCLAPGAATDASALELASNFVETIGAQPLFMDPVEHDGIIAGVEELPQLVGAALMHMLAAAPGWTEARRLAGRTFAQSTDLGRSPAHLFAALRTNRANLLVRLDQFARELEAWRAWLQTDEADKAQDPLLIALTETAQERDRWETQAILHNWDAASTQDRQDTPGIWRQLFLGNLGGKRPPKDE